MLKLGILLVAFLATKFGSCMADLRDEEIISFINSANTSWRASDEFLPGVDIKPMLGVRFEEDHQHLLPPLVHHVPVNQHILPLEFDARKNWPRCRSIKDIQEQSMCGSSWAVTAASTITDRVCIDSSGEINPRLSTRDILTCTKESHGCAGGDPALAWRFWVEKGVVSGGPYDSNRGCQPNPLPPCRSWPNETITGCEEQVTPSCVPECQKDYPYHYLDDKHFGVRAYYISGEVPIQEEIYLYGPVQASFVFYEDFRTYESGIYEHKYGKPIGMHSGKIIGWGEENGVKYWLVANSWGTDFGEDGYFRIRRGYNECEIEQLVIGGRTNIFWE